MTIDQAAAQPAGLVCHVGNGDRFVCHSLSDRGPPGECVFICALPFASARVCGGARWPRRVIHYSLSRKQISLAST